MIATFIITLVRPGVIALPPNLPSIQRESQDNDNYDCDCVSFSNVQL